MNKFYLGIDLLGKTNTLQIDLRSTVDETCNGFDLPMHVAFCFQLRMYCTYIVVLHDSLQLVLKWIIVPHWLGMN